MHQQLLAEVVRPDDVFINVFPKHQKEIEEHKYPGEVQEILDPAEFTTQLCSCRAIISTRLHGIILGLHMGVPTFAAFHTSYGNKVPELMLDIIRLPEQFLVINEHLNRDIVDLQVEAVRRLYVSRGRRSYIHARLSEFHDQFESHAKHVLFDVIGAERGTAVSGPSRESAGEIRAGSFPQKETALIKAPSNNEGGGTFIRPKSAGFIQDGIPGREGGGVKQTVADDNAENADQETSLEQAQGGGLSNLGGQKATASETLAAERAGLSEALRQGAADPSTLLEDVTSRSPGKGLVTPNTPVPARTGAYSGGSERPFSDQGGSIADVLLANRSAFKTSAENSEEMFDASKNTHHAVAAAVTNINNAAAELVMPESEESVNPKAPVGPGMGELGAAPNARDDAPISDDSSNPHRATLKNKVASSDGVVSQTQTTGGDPAVTTTSTAAAASAAAAEARAHGSSKIGSESSKTLVLEQIDTNIMPPPLPPATPTLRDAGASYSLIVNDYVAAMLLLAAIVFLALLPPSGGTTRRAPADGGFSETEPALGACSAHTHVQQELLIDSRYKGDSELGAGTSTNSAERSTAFAVRAPAVGATMSTSPKMLFLLNFVMWVSLAMAFSAYAKAYLRETREPIGLVALQGTTGVAVLCALGRFRILDLYPGKNLTPAAARQAGLAATLHTAQALLTNVAVLVGGVAATNALKAMEPIAAALFSYFLLGKNCSGPRLASIFTIAAGIIVFTSTGSSGGGGSERGGRGGVGGGGGEAGGGEAAEEERSFSNPDNVGISTIIIVGAVCCNALRNVVIKKGDPIPPHQTLFACSAAAAAVGISMMLMRASFSLMEELASVGARGGGENTGRSTSTSTSGGIGGGDDWLRVSGVNAALCFVGYNFASFNLLARLSPVGHAVGNSCKRVLVFAGGLLFLGEVMSARQLGGAALALTGVLAYNVSGAR